MTKEDFKKRVNMAYKGREHWEAFLEAMWQVHQLECAPWRAAQASYFPSRGRNVVALQKIAGKGYKVVFAHRPEPKPKPDAVQTYGDGEWNLPDIEWWLDLDLPYEHDKKATTSV